MGPGAGSALSPGSQLAHLDGGRPSARPLLLEAFSCRHAHKPPYDGVKFPLRTSISYVEDLRRVYRDAEALKAAQVVANREDDARSDYRAPHWTAQNPCRRLRKYRPWLTFNPIQNNPDCVGPDKQDGGRGAICYR